MPPLASIVVVHHRGLERLFRTLEAAESQARGRRCEVILVDNASTEGAAQEAARRFPGVRLLREERNRGFAFGCRRGALASEARDLIFLNDDAVPEPGWLEAFLSASETLPADVFTLAGRLTDVTGKRNDFSDGFLTFDGHAFSSGVGRPVDSGEESSRGEERLFACGGNMLVRRREFFESGGFDDDYFAYLEDVDFGWRQWIFGRRILFEPAASVRHEGGATGEALGVFNRGFLIEKNALLTAVKNFENLRERLASIYLALLCRITTLVSSRNAGAEELKRDPYAEEKAAGRAISRRLSRWLGFSPRATEITLADPLTIAHLRALLEGFGDLSRLSRKRREIQERRQRGDAEIFAKFPLSIVETYPGDEALSTEFFRELLPAGEAFQRRALDEIFIGGK
jgi:hypothetical protein